MVTGLTYQAKNLSQPSSQYCYWTEPLRQNDSTKRFDLGSKTSEGGIVWYENELVEEYKQFCQFLKS